MPSAKRAEEGRPFIDLRSLSEDGELAEPKEASVPLYPPQEVEPATIGAPRDPRYVGGWRINERFASHRGKQAQASARSKEDVLPPKAAQAVKGEPEGLPENAAITLAEQPPSGPSTVPGGSGTLPTPPALEPTVPPVPTSTQADILPVLEEGRQAPSEDDRPPQTDEEGLRHSSHEEGGDEVTSPETAASDYEDGAEPAIKTGYARVELKIVKVSCPLSHRARSDEHPCAPGDIESRASMLFLFPRSSRGITRYLRRSLGCSLPASPLAESREWASMWPRMAAILPSFSPSARAKEKRNGGRNSEDREYTRGTSRPGPLRGGIVVPTLGTNSVRQKGRGRVSPASTPRNGDDGPVPSKSSASRSAGSAWLARRLVANVVTMRASSSGSSGRKIDVPPVRHDGERGPQASNGGLWGVRVAGVVHTTRGATVPAKGRRRGCRQPRNRPLPSQNHPRRQATAPPLPEVGGDAAPLPTMKGVPPLRRDISGATGTAHTNEGQVSVPSPVHSTIDPLSFVSNKSTRVDLATNSFTIDDCEESGWTHPCPLEEDWGLGSREYSIQGISHEQPLFAFRCDGTAGLCLIDSGATLNLVSKDFTEKAGLETRPLKSPLRVSPFEGPPLRLTREVKLDVVFSPTWPLIGVTAVQSQMMSPALILGTGWTRSLNASVTWPRPVLTIRPSTAHTCRTVQVSDPSDGDGPELKETEKKLFERYTVAFDPLGKEPAKVPFTVTIALKADATPVKTPPYRLPEAQMDQLRTEIQDYLDKGWVRPSMSPWATPVTYVKKQDGSLHLVFDYRKVNKQTHDDASPLPRIDQLLSGLNGAQFYSKIDLKQGYNQIPMEESSIAITAFVIPIAVRGARHFEWTVLPFGLKNAPPIFQRVMGHVLQGLDKFALVYMDDVLIYSKDRAEHLLHVEKVLERLKRCRNNTGGAAYTNTTTATNANTTPPPAPHPPYRCLKWMTKRKKSGWWEEDGVSFLSCSPTLSWWCRCTLSTLHDKGNRNN